MVERVVMLKARGRLLALVALGFVVGVTASSASAATTIGSNLTGSPDGTVTCSPSCTVANGTIAPGSVATGGSIAPLSGVLTRWTVRTASTGGDVTTQARLRVIDGQVATASSAAATIEQIDGLQEFVTRLPIAAGETVGIDVFGQTSSDAPMLTVSTGANSMNDWQPALPEVGTGVGGVQSGHVLLQARIEPDADGDGYGDETQDGCPTDAGASGPCPVVIETTITKAPKIVKARKAVFEFTATAAGATFECARDQQGFKPCASPLKLRKLKAGRHKIAVRAVLGGYFDVTPAVAGFRVKKPKRARRDRTARRPSSRP